MTDNATQCRVYPREMILEISDGTLRETMGGQKKIFCRLKKRQTAHSHPSFECVDFISPRHVPLKISWVLFTLFHGVLGRHNIGPADHTAEREREREDVC